jgi:RimJ/RimL family protein N-acetyltransferase
MDDLEDIHRVLCAAWDVSPDRWDALLPERERWLRWSVASYEELANLSQPPYGDRAVELKATGRIIGAVGLVPSLGPFGQLPGFPANSGSRHWFPEVGLYWAIDPDCQGQGYATEAAQALVERAFNQFRLGRIVATTEHTNARSMAVMRKLGMEILRNPYDEPAWFQVVGVLHGR